MDSVLQSFAAGFGSLKDAATASMQLVSRIWTWCIEEHNGKRRIDSCLARFGILIALIGLPTGVVLQLRGNEQARLGNILAWGNMCLADGISNTTRAFCHQNEPRTVEIERASRSSWSHVPQLDVCISSIFAMKSTKACVRFFIFKPDSSPILDMLEYSETVFRLVAVRALRPRPLNVIVEAFYAAPCTSASTLCTHLGVISAIAAVVLTPTVLWNHVKVGHS
ncbi:hypothetical protein LTR78_005260 [Recurvomyces mirabilis]|uniref:Uncharacterized protein n=1 Tax=Recurvomyces mirabilis TaxID=574656 RepID=A0AAE0WNE5_9PEZI|nr:hypothetical protein LTR78_005260 [Recurvomyces mirabilis]KAK5157810.1 hypothetical protein LTS14_003732 [Recurvomyces mirabilis]